MKTIVALQALVTAASLDAEPTAAELDAIEREMPVITAELELLDAQITALDRTPSRWTCAGSAGPAGGCWPPAAS